MTAHRLLPLLPILFCLFPSAAGAQAPPDARPRPKPLEGAGEFSFVATGGNSSTQTIGLSGHAVFRPDSWELRTKVAFVRNTSSGELKAKSLAAGFRASRRFSPRFSAFGQYDYLRNLFAGIEHRNAAESGVAYRMVDGERHRLGLDAALGVAGERRLAREDRTSGTALLGTSYWVRVSNTTEFTHDLQVIESLARARDWRANNGSALTTRINSIFSLKLSHTMRYVADPVPGFEKTDTISSVALVAKF